jgi:hypothetical protein
MDALECVWFLHARVAKGERKQHEADDRVLEFGLYAVVFHIGTVFPGTELYETCGAACCFKEGIGYSFFA